MLEPLRDEMIHVGERIVAFLPDLLAGLLLVGAGVVAGWMAKRISVRLLFLFRLDRLLVRFRWGAGLGRADVRYAMFEFIGNLVYLVVFLVFLDSAFVAMKMTVLSTALDWVISFFPRLAAALGTFAIGWFAAGRVAERVVSALRKEHVPRASLAGRYVRAAIGVFSGAVALTILRLAPWIVLVGFTVAISTLAVIAVLYYRGVMAPRTGSPSRIDESPRDSAP